MLVKLNFIIGRMILHKMLYLRKRLWWAFSLQGVLEASNRDGFCTKNVLILGWRRRSLVSKGVWSTLTNSAAIFKEHHSTWPNEQREQQKNSVTTAINVLALLKACILYFFNKTYYLNYIPMRHITSYAQLLVTNVFLV